LGGSGDIRLKTYLYHKGESRGARAGWMANSTAPSPAYSAVRAVNRIEKSEALGVI